MAQPHDSIGIFDSGFGGLTVMREICSLLPYESITYFGDTAHLPYGNKSSDTVLTYCLENSAFLIEQGIKLLVIACNTACAFGAIETISKHFPIPIIGVISPGVDDLIAATHNQKVAILGTRGTISSSIHQNEIRKKLTHAQVTSIACPLFVPLVEEGFIDHPITELAVKEYLSVLKKEEVDTILLGCTHYPLIEALIQNEVGPRVKLINPAMSCAKQAFSILKELCLLAPIQKPSYQFFVSDDPDQFRRFGSLFFKNQIESVEKRTPRQLAELKIDF